MSNGHPLAKIRIARVSTVPFFVRTQLKTQLEDLAKTGAVVHVVTSPGPDIAAIERIPGIRCEAIDIPRAISPWRDMLALVRLCTLFRREKFQIVHSTTPKAGLLCALAAWAAGVPVRIHTFTGQPWLTMRGFRRFLSIASDWLIGKLNTCCYTDSPSQRNFMIDRKILRAGSVSVIGAGSLAGVDTHRFNPDKFSARERAVLREELGIDDDEKILLFVGRISPDKGVRELLAAFRRLRVDGLPVHLVLLGPLDVGSGTEGTVEWDELKHNEYVHLLGYSTVPERYMAIADILCLPSYREGFGTVVIEAAAMGLPTVGTNIYGLSDAVVDGVTGLLVPPKDVDALANAVQSLLRDEATLKGMQAAARNRALKLFKSTVISELLIAEYIKLIRQRGKDQ